MAHTDKSKKERVKKLLLDYYGGEILDHLVEKLSLSIDVVGDNSGWFIVNITLDQDDGGSGLE